MVAKNIRGHQEAGRCVETLISPESNPWLVLESPAGEPAFNMALDEAVLEAMPRLGKPTLRFYGWTQPAASFGYFQKFAEIERLTMLRPLVCRPTGGGLVPHDADWTYSLAIPTNHAWYSLTAKESYRRIHVWIQTAFSRLNLVTELAPCCRKTQPGQCFMGWEKDDVLWENRKIAGAAQRRTRSGLLLQGSIQPPPLALRKRDWEQVMLNTACANEGVEWTHYEPDPLLLESAELLAREKYAQDSHNRKR